MKTVSRKAAKSSKVPLGPVRFCVPIDIFDYDVNVIAGCPFSVAKDAVLARFPEISSQLDDVVGDSFAGLSWDNSKIPSVTFIWLLSNQVEDEKERGTIYHEALHATYNIMKAVGIRRCPETEEVTAYMQGFIAKSIIKALT